MFSTCGQKKKHNKTYWKAHKNISANKLQTKASAPKWKTISRSIPVKDCFSPRQRSAGVAAWCSKPDWLRTSLLPHLPTTSLSHPNQISGSISFRLRTPKVNDVASFLKAGYSLPVCLFLNVGILTGCLFIHQTCSGPRGEGWDLESKAQTLWRHSAPSEKQRNPIHLVYVTEPAHMCGANMHGPGQKFSNSTGSAEPPSTRTACVRANRAHTS